MVSTISLKRYSISTIKEEALSLVQMKVVGINQPLRILFDYLPARQWNMIECELERHDYLLRDRIIDLIGEVGWDND